MGMITIQRMNKYQQKSSNKKNSVMSRKRKWNPRINLALGRGFRIFKNSKPGRRSN